MPGTLFGCGHLTDTEDSQAGYAGVPFTQLEDEEQWVDWVDWGAVQAQTSGAGSSS